MSQNHNADPSVEAGVIVETELKEPDMYRVLLHNDDYTQMDFVVQVLVEIFRKSNEEAVAILRAEAATEYKGLTIEQATALGEKIKAGELELEGTVHYHRKTGLVDMAVKGGQAHG